MTSASLAARISARKPEKGIARIAETANNNRRATRIWRRATRRRDGIAAVTTLKS